MNNYAPHSHTHTISEIIGLQQNQKLKTYYVETLFISILFTIVMVTIFLLNPIHEKNINKLKNTKQYKTPVWEPELRGQEYTMTHGEWVFYWKSDEKPVRVGMVYVLWGYYRIIAHKDGMTEFRDVEWCNANF